jgi:phosphate transport system protein
MNQDRRHVAVELEALRARLLAMGGLAQDLLRRAMRGLVGRDLQLLADVIAADAGIDDLQMEVDGRCFTLIALHQPVALDLRMLVSAPRISADLERVGDLARNIAKSAGRMAARTPIRLPVTFESLASQCQKMLRDALDAFVQRDVERAKRLLAQDEEVDDRQDLVIREALAEIYNHPDIFSQEIDLILVAKNLERVADHATNIAESVILVVEGRNVKHADKLARGAV